MLNIISYNVNRLEGRLGELGLIIQKYAPDLVLVQETWLKPGKPTPYFHGYTVHRADRPPPTRGGGLLVIIKSTLEHKVEARSYGKIETLSVSTCHVTISNVYCRLGHVRHRDFALLDQAQSSTIFMGDWNSQHLEFGDARTNTIGPMVAKVLRTTDLVVTRPQHPTRQAPGQQGGQGSFLDFAITTPDVKVLSIETLRRDNTTSDHLPVLLKVGEAEEGARFYRHTTNWAGVIKELERPWVMTWDVEYDVAHFTSSCQAAMLNNTRSVRVRLARYHLLPRHIVALQKKRKDLYKEVHKLKNTNPGRIKLVKKEARLVGREINAFFKKQQQEKIGEDLEDMQDRLKRWWVLKRDRPRPPPVPSLVSHRGVAVTAAEKAEVLAEALRDKFVNTFPGQTADEADAVRRVYAAVGKLPPGALPSLTMADLNAAIAQLKVKSAPGGDGVSNRLLRLLPEGAKAHLLAIFNNIIATRVFPESWKHAVVTMLPKPGKPANNPSSYRPISLLSCVAKLFERCILRFYSTDCLPDHQFGYRQGLSCTMQLTRLVTDLTAALNLKQKALVVSLDIEAAFDKVPHKELIFKLVESGQPGWLVQLTKSYYQGRTFSIKVQGVVSAPQPVGDGTAQGAVISALLYSTYIADMPVSKGVRCYQYADDSLYACTAERPGEAFEAMNAHLNKVAQWCRRWRTKVNATKSKALLVRGGSMPQGEWSVRMGEDSVPLVRNIKYLGVYLDDHLNFEAHTDHLRQWGKTRNAQLWKWVACRRLVSEETKLLLYKALILSKLTYGLPSWQGTSQANFEKLRVLERKWIRGITFAPRHYPKDSLYDLCPAINIRRDAEACREKFRVHFDHPNPLVAKIFHPLPNGRKTYPLDPVAPGLF